MPRANSSFGPLNGGRAEALRRIDRGAQDGLRAQAYVIWREWKRQMASHKGGFTTGAFVGKGRHAAQRITIGPLIPLGRFGEYAIQVGTDVLYHLFWELGHMNAYTRKYERVETLRPAVEDTTTEQRAAYDRKFRAAVGD